MASRLLLGCALLALFVISASAFNLPAKISYSSGSPAFWIRSSTAFKTASGFEDSEDRNWVDFGFVAAVNLGVSRPGREPGENILTQQDYLRYLGYAYDLGSNAIRIYTILTPEFYVALNEFNTAKVALGKSPMMVLQGIWTPEEELIGSDKKGTDAWVESTRTAMKDYVYRTITAMHGGGATVAYRTNPSVQTGVYTASIAQYVLGFVVGTEWDPGMVDKTITAHPDKTGATFSAKYVSATSDAHALEVWIAEMLELAAELDMAHGWQHPMSHANWITTDPLYNPLEPRAIPSWKSYSFEDWMSVDAMHLDMTSDWKAGYFATTHFYPYYPDFLTEPYSCCNVPSSLVDYVTSSDPFDAHLQRLRLHHRRNGVNIPYIIAEIGLPTSWAPAHLSYGDRNHGGMSESQQGTLTAGLIQLIKQDNMQGLALFELVDEWFKKSWNTQDLENNKAYWLNVMSSEKFFGVFRAEAPQVIVIDGKADDWAAIAAPTLTTQSTLLSDGGSNSEKLQTVASSASASLSPSTQAATQAVSTGVSSLSKFAVTHDTAFVYLLFELADDISSFSDLRFYVAFDTVPGSGATKISMLKDTTLAQDTKYTSNEAGTLAIAADYVLLVDVKRQKVSTYQNQAQDYVIRKKGVAYGMATTASVTSMQDSTAGVFQPYQVRAKDVSMVPTYPFDKTGVSQEYTVSAAVLKNMGDLAMKSSDPNSASFDNRAGWYKSGSVLEVRVPWALLGYSDPSHKETYSLTGVSDTTAIHFVTSSLNYELVVLQQNSNGKFSRKEAATGAYTWQNWGEEVPFVESPKQSFTTIQTALITARGTDKWTLGITKTPSPYTYTPPANYYKTKSGFHLWQYIVFSCLIFLFINLGISGIIRPFVYHIIMPCFCLPPAGCAAFKLQMVSFITLAAIFSPFFYNSYKEGGLWYEFLYQIWTAAWDFAETDMVFEWAQIIWYVVVCLDAVLLIGLTLIFAWRNPKIYPKEIRDREVRDDPKSVQQKLGPAKLTHAFVISAHNSSDKLQKTITTLLRRCQPWQVFVADNGSSAREIADTKEVCQQLTDAYIKANPGYSGGAINFGSIDEGSKTVAQFCATFSLSASPVPIQLATYIDDDTRLPENWNPDKISAIFEKDPRIACLAYPLCATEEQIQSCALPQMQNFEYLTSAFVKICHSKISTALFASGAFSTWRTNVFLDVLLRHDTMHNGDDLQQGLILHKLHGKPYVLDATKRHDIPYRVEVCSDVICPTDVPFCWSHIPDFLTCCKLPGCCASCSCGEPSLFKQRAKGWDVSRQRFFWKYVKVVFSLTGFSWKDWWVKLLALWETILIINDWMILFMCVFLAITATRPFLQSFIVSVAATTIAALLFNYAILRKEGISVSFDVLSVFYLYKLPLILLFRTYAMLWNLFYYVPCVRNKLKIRLRMERDRMKFVPMVKQAYHQKTMRKRATSRITTLKGVSALSKMSSFTSHRTALTGTPAIAPSREQKAQAPPTPSTPSAPPMSPSQEGQPPAVPPRPADFNSVAANSDFSRGFKLLIRAMALPATQRDAVLAGAIDYDRLEEIMVGDVVKSPTKASRHRAASRGPGKFVLSPKGKPSKSLTALEMMVRDEEHKHPALERKQPERKMTADHRASDVQMEEGKRLLERKEGERQRGSMPDARGRGSTQQQQQQQQRQQLQKQQQQQQQPGKSGHVPGSSGEYLLMNGCYSVTTEQQRREQQQQQPGQGQGVAGWFKNLFSGPPQTSPPPPVPPRPSSTHSSRRASANGV